MKHILLASLLAVLSGCASTPSVTPVQPSPTKPSNQPSRFDYERDDDLDEDLSRSSAADSPKAIA
ncbi:MAG: hypothetical protein ACKO6E_01065 [Planctomycetota bacterium]